MDISDATSEAVLAELNEGRRVKPSGCVLACLLAVLLTIGFAFAPLNLIIAGLSIGWHVQRLRRSKTLLWYDLDPHAASAWQVLRGSLLGLARARKIWRVASRAQVHDGRYHAGASKLVERTAAQVGEQAPDGIETNIAPVCVIAGDLTLYFFPDRVLLYRATDIGGAGYDVLRAKARLTTFVEDETPPSDARISGHTWQFVNKNGSPDRRFANNRQLSICEYELLELTTASGLHVEMHVSAQGPAREAAATLMTAGKARQQQKAATPAQAAGPPPLPKPLPTASSAAPVVEPSPPPPPPLAQATGLSWIPAAQPVEFSGLTIPDGMIWWHQGERDYGEPSGVSVYQPVAAVAASMDGDLDYWPAYDRLFPEQRRAYLEWMVQGRRDAEPSRRALGYVFLFFYGIERRLIVDHDAEPALFIELIELLRHYGPSNRSNTLRGYFLQTLHFAGWRLGEAFYDALWPHLLELGGEQASEQDLAFILAHFHLTRKPLPWNLALRVAQADEDSRNSTVVARTGEKFRELFRQRYQQAFGDGIQLEAAKSELRITYRPASAGLAVLRDAPDHREHFELRLPNVRGLSRQFKKLPQLWNECVDDLSSYSRILVAKDPCETAAWEALPDELRRSTSHPLTATLAKHAAESPVERGFALTQAGSLAMLLGLTQRKKLTQAQCRELMQTLSAAGYHLAPNPEFTFQSLAWEQPVAFYPRQDGEESLGEALPGVVRFLHLAVAVAAADGSLDDAELETFNRAIAVELTREVDLRHLRATEAALCQDANVAARAVAQIADHIGPQARHAVLWTLLHLSAADGDISLDELRMLRRIARAFEVDEDWIDTWVQEIAEQKEVTVSGAKAAKGGGEAIPPRPQAASPSQTAQRTPAAPTFQLDMNRIRELTQETHEVVAILNEVMSDEEAAEVTSAHDRPVTVAAPVPPWFDGLDPRFHAPLLVLIEHDELSADRFDRLAKEHHLLPDDLLSSVNTWSDERLGDFLLEKDDSVKVFRGLLPAA